MKKVKVKYVGANEISKLKIGDWIDLSAAEDVEIKKGAYQQISLGVAMKLPRGYEAHIVPRSSTFKKYGILQTNGIGIIDNSYCGENDIWQFPAFALRDTAIKKGERICQFRIVKKMRPLKLKTVYHLNKNSRGGFGSTGN